MNTKITPSGALAGRKVWWILLTIGAVAFESFVAWTWIVGGLDVSSGAGTVSLVLVGVTVLLLVVPA